MPQTLTNSSITLQHIRAGEVEEAILQAGYNPEQLVTITVQLEKKKRNICSYERTMEIVKRLQESVNPDDVLTDDDLYDENGLPK